MRYIQRIILCVWAILALNIVPGYADETGMTLPEVILKITPSVVAIATEEPLRSPRILMRGTGFVVYDGLHIITNAHVLPRPVDMKYNEKIVVMIGRGQNPDLRYARIVRIDRQHDLALLKVGGHKIPKFTLGSGGLIAEGTDIAVTGFPIGSVLGLYPVTNKGIISAITPIVIPQLTAHYLNPKVISQTRYDVYQLDLTAFPGNSGSPMYNATTGRVEGILNSVAVRGTKENALTNPSGISFAIPVIYLRNLLRDAGLK
ncbi:MAG: trypsin-like peptidase domain-containing protein [Alphaproteobacteria bacterium]|nr:trypsin-like peptidase domain-containing protein [Alphaproteobacteria bacterium]